MANDRSPAPPAATDDQQGFLSRWSRRKSEAARGEPPARDEPAAEALPVPGPAPEPQTQPVLTDADMPPLESLGPDSDYSPFWSPGVSEELRRLALRKLFASPQFNIRDGLDDYDEDYTIFEPLRPRVTTIAESAGERARAYAEGLADAGDPAGGTRPEGCPPSALEPDEGQVAASEADSGSGGADARDDDGGAPS